MGTTFPSELYARFFISLKDNHSDLKTASLVCHQFRDLAQTHLFATFRFDGKSKQLGEKVRVLSEYTGGKEMGAMREADVINIKKRVHKGYTKSVRERARRDDVPPSSDGGSASRTQQTHNKSWVLTPTGSRSVEEPVAEMLPYFTSVTTLFMNGVESLDALRYNQWGLVNQHLRDSLFEHLFPRLNVLSIEWQLGLPFLSILNACSNLCHLSLRQSEGTPVSLQSQGTSTTPGQSLYKPHPLESLIVGTYSSEDFENDNSLIAFLDLAHCELRKIQLRVHVNTLHHFRPGLHSVENVFFQLTEDISSIQLYGPHEYLYPPRITPQESLWWRGSDHFFKWIALELEEVQSPATHPFRRVLIDLRLEGPMTVPVKMAKVDWTAMQNVLLTFKRFENMTFRLIDDEATMRLGDELCPLMKEALTAIDKVGKLKMFEKWERPEDSINSAILDGA
ncbi:hypothetical protein DL96DRAFT_1757474 [Flagelloscypha sp. PMI_526]|nr:hypothetical protein DL96DRAFT_1757474 [Flagelloscypha sp. PMI_526]